MKRTDRLLKILNFLQSRHRAVTAERIAQECEVSVRTTYRDIKELISSGVPIDGEAGVGYMMDEGYHLPPLTFDVEEIESLVLGMAMVCNWTDAKMARSARSALDKIKTPSRKNYWKTCMVQPSIPLEVQVTFPGESIFQP